MYRSDKQFMKNPATAAMRIYIGNLADTVVPDNLEERFKQHGHILGMHAQKGFAFIQYETADQAKTAIEREHGTQLHNRKINVKHANVDKRPIPGQGQGGGGGAGDQRVNQRGSFGESMNRSMNDPTSMFGGGGGGGASDSQGPNRGGGIMAGPNHDQAGAHQGPNNQLGGAPMEGSTNQGPMAGQNNQAGGSIGRSPHDGGLTNQSAPNMGRNMNEGGSLLGRGPMNDGPVSHGGRMGDRDQQGGPGNRQGVPAIGPDRGNRGDWGNQRGDDRSEGDNYDSRNKFGGGGRNRGRGGRGKPYNSRDRVGGRDNFVRDDRDDNEFSDNQYGSRSGLNNPDLSRGPPGGGPRGGPMGGSGGPMRGHAGPMGNSSGPGGPMSGGHGGAIGGPGGPRGNIPLSGDGHIGVPMDSGLMGSPRFGKPAIIEKLPGPAERAERNDCEIIVVSKQLTVYAEYVEQRLKALGLVVDLLYPNEDVPIGRVLANISSRGCLFAILVMPQNEENRSLTLNILHGIPQEHRNMPLEDSLILITRNFDAYMRGEVLPTTDDEDTKKLIDRHPDQIQTVFNLLAENRQLSSGQYDRVIKYLEDRKELQMQFELAEGIESDLVEPEVKNKRAELQNRILNILNKSEDIAPSVNLLKSDTLTSTTISTPTSISGSITAGQTPLLNDPSVQKALDSILMGDMFKGLTGTMSS